MSKLREQGGRWLLAALAGALLTASLAPISIWPAALLGLAILSALLHRSTRKDAFLLGWFFGAGLFGTGTSWVFVSIHWYGNAPVPLAALLTFIFCGGLALLPAAACYLQRRLNPAQNAATDVLLFVGLWVLFEWLRTWLLTGFPWLFVGYSQVSGPLAGLAPMGGVLSIGLVLALTAAVTSLIRELTPRQGLAMTSVVMLCWATALMVKPTSWTQDSGAIVNAGLVQANIDQNDKWRPELAGDHIQLQLDLSEPLWGHDLVLWPEAAIPALHDRALAILDDIGRRAQAQGSTFISGIPYRDLASGEIFNAIVARGDSEQIYTKRQLVPFGEFMPLESLLRGMIDFFDLPMSSFTAGPDNQQALQIDQFTAAALICYEAVYLDLVHREDGALPDFLLTISNDTWFGGSLGPLQHLEMAQMRALEWGRSMIRGTNNGVSAFIDRDGKILSRTEQFEQAVLSDTLRIYTGQTPYARFGPTPVVVVGFLLCFAGLICARRR